MSLRTKAVQFQEECRQHPVSKSNSISRGLFELKNHTSKISVKKVQNKKPVPLYQLSEITAENFDIDTLKKFTGSDFPLHMMLLRKDLKGPPVCQCSLKDWHGFQDA